MLLESLQCSPWSQFTDTIYIHVLDYNDLGLYLLSAYSITQHKAGPTPSQSNLQTQIKTSSYLSNHTTKCKTKLSAYQITRHKSRLTLSLLNHTTKSRTNSQPIKSPETNQDQLSNYLTKYKTNSSCCCKPWQTVTQCRNSWRTLYPSSVGKSWVLPHLTTVPSKCDTGKMFHPLLEREIANNFNSRTDIWLD